MYKFEIGETVYTRAQGDPTKLWVCEVISRSEQPGFGGLGPSYDLKTGAVMDLKPGRVGFCEGVEGDQIGRAS